MSKQETLASCRATSSDASYRPAAPRVVPAPSPPLPCAVALRASRDFSTGCYDLERPRARLVKRPADGYHEPVIARSGRLVQAVVRPLTEPRRFQLYGIGAPKTGTTSLAALFRSSARAAHEPDIDGLGRLALRRQARHGAIRRALWWRDRRLWLEVESSQLLGFFLPELVALFPNARFVCTVRDALSWLESTLEHELTFPISPLWRAIADLRFEAARFVHGAGDEPLRRRGLYPLAAYLGYFRRHHERVLATVPASRLLWVPTDSLARAPERIARFVGLDPRSLDPGSGHANRSQRRHDVLRELDPSFLADALAQVAELEAHLAALAS